MTKVCLIGLLSALAAVICAGDVNYVTVENITTYVSTKPTPTPKLTLVPTPKDGSNLISYNSSDPNSFDYLKNELDEFLKPYTDKRQDTYSIFINCDPNVPPMPGSDAVCKVKVDNWVPCVERAGYNFNSAEGGPCIFLKLNKIFGWTPEYYNSSTFPDVMPKNLKENIRYMEHAQRPHSNSLQVVWVSCEGENPADEENMGPIIYHPKFGFDGKYFPFSNVEDYLSPLVAVHFEKPIRGVVINIECKAWTRDIIHDSQERQGSVRFQLLVD